MTTTFNPAIAVIQQNAWAVMPLANLIALDDGIDADACAEVLGKGETWVEGGGAAPVAYIVNLDHRDTPLHFPSRACADLAYSAFCFHRGLPHIDARENHIQQMLLSAHDHIDNTAVWNWLGAFCDAYDDLEG